MQPNLKSFDRAVRAASGVVALVAAAVFFTHAIARLFVAFIGAVSLWEAYSAHCYLYSALGVRKTDEKISTENRYLLGLITLQAVIAYVWGESAWIKISNPGYLSGMAKTLISYASENPYAWYREFLTGYAIANAEMFGNAVAWGEAAVAVALLSNGAAQIFSKNETTKRRFLLAAVIALYSGMFMNANFYFAAGWTAPGLRGVNVVMFWTQAVLAGIWSESYRSAVLRDRHSRETYS